MSGKLELKETGQFRGHQRSVTVNTKTGETFQTFENLHADLDNNSAVDAHNLRVASRHEHNMEVQSYLKEKHDFRATDELFLHRVKYRSFGTLCYIPIPIPCLCHKGDYIDFLINDTGEVYPAFIPSHVLQMTPVEICTDYFCPTPYCHDQIQGFLKDNGYTATNERMPCECQHKANFPIWRNGAGMDASCVFSVRCQEVIKYSKISARL